MNLSMALGFAPHLDFVAMLDKSRPYALAPTPFFGLKFDNQLSVQYGRIPTYNGDYVVRNILGIFQSFTTHTNTEDKGTQEPLPMFKVQMNLFKRRLACMYAEIIIHAKKQKNIN